MIRGHAAPTIAAVAAWLGLLSISPAAGQAVCSAPHSSPTLSRAGIGTLLPGTGWVQLGFYRSSSSRFFGPDGDPRPFLADGRATTSSAFVTAAIGIVDGVEVWVQLPLHRLVFNDVRGERSRLGIGDPRIATRIGAAIFGLYDVPVSVRAGIKLPGSDFPVDPDLLPLTEGQADVEVALEAGGFLPSLPIHVVGWLGYRWRFEDAERDRKPGDERFLQLGVGGPVRGLQWELAVEALSGLDLEQQGLALSSARRRLVQIVPTLGWSVGAAQVEVSGRFNTSGRNLPSGHAFTAAVRLPWRL